MAPPLHKPPKGRPPPGQEKGGLNKSVGSVQVTSNLGSKSRQAPAANHHHVLVGLDEEEEVALAAEVRDFCRVCRALAWLRQENRRAA